MKNLEPTLPEVVVSPIAPTAVARIRHFALAIILSVAASGLAMGGTIYNSIPSPLPPNVASQGFQATGGAELGELIHTTGPPNAALTTVTVGMSDWAVASLWPSFPGSGGPTWNHPITLNLYDIDNSGPDPAPGTQFATKTQTFAIPWRPAADPTCPNGTDWRDSNGSCHGGIAFTIAFDMTGTTVPSDFIYGVAFDTQTYGYNPINSPGPYISLNLGFAQVPPTIGSNPFPDTAYWNSASAAYYADGGAGGVNTFRRDTGWAPYSVAARFDISPAPRVNPVPMLDLRGLAVMAMLLAGSALAIFARGGSPGR